MTLQAETNGRPTTEEFVQYEVADGVATIWLNRPEVKNCVNWVRRSSVPRTTTTRAWC
jgi:hypothetical protein